MTQPIVWSIAGSDPSGGAGIQADLKTINALGAYGCSVITALTAQNTQLVQGIELPSLGMVEQQLEALENDLPPAAVKLGMLGEPAAIRAIAATLQRLSAWIVCDPVLLSTTGHTLLEDTARKELMESIFPWVDLLTPNRVEAEILSGVHIRSEADCTKAAERFLAMGVKSILIKGGHSEGHYSQDYWTDGESEWWFSSPRIETLHTHGTGCTLSAAITAALGLGFELLDAVVIGKSYVNQGLRLAPQLGHGNGPLYHGPWPGHFEDFPWQTPTATEGRVRYQFPDCGAEALGFYPIVPSVEWVEKLAPLGVSTIQLRIKNLSGELLEREIARACTLANDFGTRLFINDHWEWAIKYGAYGVHLGQEDLQTADLKQLETAGLRLGISTHCYAEVSRAVALRPSYIAIGPIFPTTTKTMRFHPQGLESLRYWRQLLPYPLVAIAGIFLENAADVIATGVDGVAVVRDILHAVDVSSRTGDWLKLWKNTPRQTPLPQLQAPHAYANVAAGTTTGPFQFSRPPAKL